MHSVITNDTLNLGMQEEKVVQNIKSTSVFLFFFLGAWSAEIIFFPEINQLSKEADEGTRK